MTSLNTVAKSDCYKLDIDACMFVYLFIASKLLDGWSDLNAVFFHFASQLPCILLRYVRYYPQSQQCKLAFPQKNVKYF